MPNPETSFPAALPLDAHNRRLLENVHPGGWENPAPRDLYDLVVVGAGTGGLVTAAIAVALGARVALVERALMGGDCLNVGCVPSKALLRAARGWAAAREAAERFGGPTVAGEGDFGAVMERMRRIRADISAHDSAARFRDLGADVFLGDARFTGPDRAEVAGATLRFRRAVIATGARAAVPPVPGLEDAEYLTNETVFSLTSLPARLGVLGGGPIGCELAQAFARFGSRVTIWERGDRLLAHDDPEAAAVVRRALERDGVSVLLGADLARVERGDGGWRVRWTAEGATDEATVDAILVAAGRAPNLEGLGLDAAEVRCGDRGVDTDDRLRTSNPRVFAVGDVTGRPAFTHAADAQARVVVPNALFFGRSHFSEDALPWCTYTSPELAHVGLTYDQAEGRGDEIDTITIPLAELDRAKVDGETEGFLRVHLQAGSDRILGATLVGEHAGEIISQITAAIVSKTGLDTLGSAIFPYPTIAEAIRRAADARRRRRLTPTAKRAFELALRILR